MFCINLLFASVSFVQRNICHLGLFSMVVQHSAPTALCDFASLAGDYSFPIIIPRGFSFFTLHSFRTQPSFCNFFLADLHNPKHFLLLVSSLS